MESDVFGARFGSRKPQSSTPNAPKAGGAAFNPTSLITGAGGFWRADMGITGTNPVTQWNDQSSFANNLTVLGSPAQTGPVFSSTGFNTSFPGVSFASGGNGLGLGNNSVTFAATSTYSVFMVINSGASSGSGLRYVWLEAHGGSDEFTNPSTETTDGFYGYSSGFLGNGGGAFTLTNNTIYMLGVVCDGTHANMWVNAAVQGAQVNFSSNIGAAGTNTLGIGLGPSSGGSKATFAFFGVTQKAMVTGDWTNLKNWSNTNWGTSF